MLNEIPLAGETEGNETYATLNDLENRSGVFNSRDVISHKEEDALDKEEEEERKRLEE
jgi:hypothetical protein